MKAVIKFKNGFGEKEYLADNSGYTKHLIDARVFRYEDDAFHMIHRAKTGIGWPPIWETAEIQLVKLTEV